MSTLPDVAAVPLSRRLREETRAVHERVEHTASFNRLIVVRLPSGDDPRLARARDEYRETYRRFLIASRGFEAAVNDALRASPAREDAARSGWAEESPDPVASIDADLAYAFGSHPPERLPSADPLPVPLTLAAFAGIEYVRRGSRAGGAVIGAIVRANLGWDRDGGAAFLCRYGRETRALLDGLRAWLDGLALDEAGADQAVAAALDTFTAVGRWHGMLEHAFTRGD
jgi:heme oxygenase